MTLIKKKDDDFKDSTEDLEANTTRNNILTLDDFIEQIFQIRRTLLGVSISALILVPIALGLSDIHIFLLYWKLKMNLETFWSSYLGL